MNVLTLQNKKLANTLNFKISFHKISYFEILMWYDSFTINIICYIVFNIHTQTIIKLLISHSITNILPKRVKKSALSFWKNASHKFNKFGQKLKQAQTKYLKTMHFFIIKNSNFKICHLKIQFKKSQLNIWFWYLG